MPIMEIAIIPVGTRTTSLSKYVADADKILKKEGGIKYQLTAMGTQIEAASLDKLLNVAGKMHNEVLRNNKDLKRVITSINIDDRRDKKLTIAGKIKSAQKKIGQK